MTTAGTGSGNWGERWSAEEVGLLRSALGLSKASFADRLEIHRRTARRWEQGDTAAIDHRIIAALDDVLCETVCQAAVWLTPIQVRNMHRRDVLRTLASGAFVPIGGIMSAPNGAPRRIGISDVNHIETVSAGLARMYKSIPSGALIDSVAAHLENATRMLRESVPSGELPRLHTMVGDLGVFLGYLSLNERRSAQAKAYLGLAKDHAREADDHELLARALVASAFADSNIARQRAPSRAALDLFEEADELAEHASPWLQTLVTAHLTEERAAANDAYGSDEAFARSKEAFARAEHTESVRNHPCAAADYHGLSSGHGLDGYQGIREVLLGRGAQAVETLTGAFARTESPRRQVVILADLAEALSQQDEPDESCTRLGQAHSICQEHHYPLGLQRILGVRERCLKRFAGLDCVRELDSRLGLG